jgi:hypothetical protein
MHLSGAGSNQKVDELQIATDLAHTHITNLAANMAALT